MYVFFLWFYYSAKKIIKLMEYLKNIDKYSFDLDEYLYNAIACEYYVMIVIEDLIRYFNFAIVFDKVNKDIRTIQMINIFNHDISIASATISNYDQVYTQFNKIQISVNNNITSTYEFYGKCYKKIKNKN